MSMYPPHWMREYRVVDLPDRGPHEPQAGRWYQVYSTRIARWCNIEYMGPST